MMKWQHFFEKHKQLGFEECLRQYRLLERAQSDIEEYTAYETYTRTNRTVGGFFVGGGSFPKLATPILTINQETGTSVLISWQPIDFNRTYILEFDTHSDMHAAQLLYAGTSTNFIHTGLTPLSTYYYRIMATNSNFPNSDQFTANIVLS